MSSWAVFLASWIFTALPAFSAVAPSIRVTSDSVMTFLKEGVVTGGQAADGYTMLAIRHEVASTEETMRFFYGDFAGNVVPNGVGYFHLAIESKFRRIVLNLSQIERTAVGPEQLKQLLKSSNLILSSRLSTDPLDGSTEIVLNFKADVEARVVLGKSIGEKHELALEFRKVAGP